MEEVENPNQEILRAWACYLSVKGLQLAQSRTGRISRRGEKEGRDPFLAGVNPLLLDLGVISRGTGVSRGPFWFLRSRIRGSVATLRFSKEVWKIFSYVTPLQI
jgi:hypothetical protein